MKYEPVLDHGFVCLLSSSGSDEEIARYAGVCTGHDPAVPVDSETVERRINQLMEREHTSPFEFAEATFYVKAPIFVARQWMRHRTFSYLERSGRYNNCLGEYYDPFNGDVDETFKQALATYEDLVRCGFPYEAARVVLPQSLYTEFVCKSDLHNLFHFLKLRLGKSAQKEIREYAQAMLNALKEIFPVSCTAFEKYKLKHECQSDL